MLTVSFLGFELLGDKASILKSTWGMFFALFILSSLRSRWLSLERFQFLIRVSCDITAFNVVFNFDLSPPHQWIRLFSDPVMVRRLHSERTEIGVTYYWHLFRYCRLPDCHHQLPRPSFLRLESPKADKAYMACRAHLPVVLLPIPWALFLQFAVFQLPVLINFFSAFLNCACDSGRLGNDHSMWNRQGFRQLPLIQIYRHCLARLSARYRHSHQRRSCLVC